MTVRFRIRTPAGQELSFATDEMFKDFVRSGDLSPDDLVYDVETGSWSPARTHPIVLEIEYENEAAEEAASAEAEGSDDAPAEADAAPEEVADDGDDASADNAFGLTLAEAQPVPDDVEPEGPVDPTADVEALVAEAAAEKAAAEQEPSDTEGAEDLGLDLAAPSERSAEEERQAFLEKMEAERRDALEFEVAGGGMQIQMESASSMSEMIQAAPQPEPAPPPPPKEKKPKIARPAPPRRDPEKSGVGRKIAIAIVALVLLGGGGYFGVQMFGQSSVEGVSENPDSVTTPVDTVTTPPPRTPVIASTEVAVRERAQERFLTATQALVRDLQPIPEAWPLGVYLSTPADHAAVLDVWQDYQTTIQDVRAGDEDRYLEAYESALFDAVIEGEEADERRSTAMTDFAATQQFRDEHYDRVEALATSAIQSHAALLEVDGLIIYDATGATGAQSGIATGAYGRDADSQFLLDQVVELLEATLAADGLGPGDGTNVREWVWDGFLDAMTREPPVEEAEPVQPDTAGAATPDTIG